MQRELYEVEKDRFDLKDSSLYHLQGTWPKDHKPEAVLDGEKLPAAISAQERVSALERFKDLDLGKRRTCADGNLPAGSGGQKEACCLCGKG